MRHQFEGLHQVEARAHTAGQRPHRIDQLIFQFGKSMPPQKPQREHGNRRAQYTAGQQRQGIVYEDVADDCACKNAANAEDGGRARADIQQEAGAENVPVDPLLLQYPRPQRPPAGVHAEKDGQGQGEVGQDI